MGEILIYNIDKSNPKNENLNLKISNENRIINACFSRSVKNHIYATDCHNNLLQYKETNGSFKKTLIGKMEFQSIKILSQKFESNLLYVLTDKGFLER